MKIEPTFVADDGARFRTADECIAHERLCERIDAVMRALPPTPQDDGCRFTNGKGYIQHERKTWEAARMALLLIARDVCPGPVIEDTISGRAHSSSAAREFADCSRPLAKAWYRFHSTDSQLREWGQPYFTDHPDEAECFQINKETTP